VLIPSDEVSEKMVTASPISKDRTFKLFLILVENPTPNRHCVQVKCRAMVYNKCRAERAFAEEMALYRRALV
jgi:hypothetical protein